VVVVEVPFSDLSGTKRRPALIVSAEKFHRALPDLIVCPISSQARFYRRPGPGDCPLRDWRRAGLRHPSTVRISKLLAVDKQTVKRKLGALKPDDLASVAGNIRQALGLHDRQA
jgi:mRNA interferase MazF